MATTSNSRRARDASKQADAPETITTDGEMPDTSVVPAIDHAIASPLEPDENAGHGGLYRLDPTTGQRTLIERTDHNCC